MIIAPCKEFQISNVFWYLLYNVHITDEFLLTILLRYVHAHVYVDAQGLFTKVELFCFDAGIASEDQNTKGYQVLHTDTVSFEWDKQTG